MARPRFTADAYRDIAEITRYIGAANPAAATRLTDRLEAECWRLARDPGVGQRRPNLAIGFLFLPVGNYLIFYRESVEGIQVIRILHGARDYGPKDF